MARAAQIRRGEISEIPGALIAASVRRPYGNSQKFPRFAPCHRGPVRTESRRRLFAVGDDEARSAFVDGDMKHDEQLVEAFQTVLRPLRWCPRRCRGRAGNPGAKA